MVWFWYLLFKEWPSDYRRQYVSRITQHRHVTCVMRVLICDTRHNEYIWSIICNKYVIQIRNCRIVKISTVMIYTAFLCLYVLACAHFGPCVCMCLCVKMLMLNSFLKYSLMCSAMQFRPWRHHPYPEPVYTGWSSVHWNATGWPSVHWDTTGRPS